MNLQKKLAAQILKASPKRVKIEQGREKEVKEAITKFDVRGLIKKGIIKKIHKQGVSRGRANKTRKQKQKGRRKGRGSRKGTPNARHNFKRDWINRIRLQRRLLSSLLENEIVTKDVYKVLYKKTKGGFFRSIAHIKLYLNENNLIKK